MPVFATQMLPKPSVMPLRFPPSFARKTTSLLVVDALDDAIGIAGQPDGVASHQQPGCSADAISALTAPVFASSRYTWSGEPPTHKAPKPAATGGPSVLPAG